ncbi:MAG: aspartate-semialdehyde dehydrogenase [Candidatus Cloacimonetes bacterium]|nr:aspartate-semialdehyde dehydrogenase [Candidatus Cloacimonadota bacterium]
MKIAVAGATGEVGRMMVRTLAEMNIPVKSLTLLASRRSQHVRIPWGKADLPVFELTDSNLRTGFDYVLFSAGGEASLRFAPVAADAGAVVIDNSSAFRRNAAIPLVAPEVNGDLLRDYSGIVANPNCSTIQLVLALHPLRRFGLTRVVVSTYQSVSGAGRRGIEAWEAEREGHDAKPVFPRRIDANVIPQIGEILPDGWSVEEDKMRHEVRRILGLPTLSVCATAVRAPVRYGHAESVWAQFEQAMTPQALAEAWSAAASLDYAGTDYITPVELADSTDSHVGRVRLLDDGRCIAFWNVGHNVRLGAATNAVRILAHHAALNR